MPPYYPIKRVKELLKKGYVSFEPNVLEIAWDDFRWGQNDVIKCLLKLNPKLHNLDPNKNHYHKTENHRFYSGAKMDYYKAKNIMEGNNVYTHFHIDEENETIVISSFHELD